MSKMGIFQRFWCLFVTVVLLLTAAGVIPENKHLAVRANGAEGILNQESFNKAESNKLAVQSEFVTTGRAAIISSESLSSRSVQPETASSKPVATMAPQSTSAPTTKKNPTKSPNSIPVAAPAADQIITTLKVMATGYTAGFESTGKTSKHPEYGITYSGVKVRRDKNAVSTIAADPKVLPLGSILYIPGYGYGVVADTGSAIKGRKIDLYFATTKQVYKEWGKKAVEVQLIKRGNGKCTEAMLKKLGKAIETYNTVPQSVLEEVI